MKVIIIPARGGSQGIPRKNLAEIGGKPLLWWTIKAAKESKRVDKIYLTTDDKEIKEFGLSQGIEVIQRPKKISDSSASSESAIIHALDQIEKTSECKVSLVVFLQATSPLRKKDDIDNAIAYYYDSKADSLFSSSIAEDLTLWQKNNKNILKSINYDYKNRAIRQDSPVQYIENGSIYIFSPDIIRKYNNRLGGKIDTFIMKAWQVHEIDAPDDLKLAEYYLKKELIK